MKNQYQCDGPLVSRLLYFTNVVKCIYIFLQFFHITFLKIVSISFDRFACRRRSGQWESVNWENLNRSVADSAVGLSLNCERIWRLRFERIFDSSTSMSWSFLYTIKIDKIFPHQWIVKWAVIIFQQIIIPK